MHGPRRSAESIGGQCKSNAAPTINNSTEPAEMKAQGNVLATKCTAAIRFMMHHVITDYTSNETAAITNAIACPINSGKLRRTDTAAETRTVGGGAM